MAEKNSAQTDRQTLRKQWSLGREPTFSENTQQPPHTRGFTPTECLSDLGRPNRQLLTRQIS